MAKKKQMLPWDKLADLKRPHKMAIFFGTLVLVAGVFAYFLILPAQNEITALTEEIDNLQAQIQRNLARKKRIPKLREELERVRLEFDFARRVLPDKKEVDQLLRDISDLGAQSGLNVVLFQPQIKEVPRDFYAEIPFEMKVEGPYLNVATFFYRISRLPRVVNIDNISMSSPRLIDEELILTTTCKGTTFRFLPAPPPGEAEAAAAAGQAQGGK